MPFGMRAKAVIRGALFLMVLASLVHVTSVGKVPAQTVSKPPTSGQPAATPPPLPVRHGTDGLPPPVVEMREAILAAVRSGSLDDLRVAIELNEIKPAFGPGGPSDPIAFVKQASADGEGREVLAALGNILEAGWVAVPLGRDLENNRVFVWPHFAETGVKGLSPGHQVELLRLVPVAQAKAMMEAGRYTFWRLAIGADGTWHGLERVGPADAK